MASGVFFVCHAARTRGIFSDAVKIYAHDVPRAVARSAAATYTSWHGFRLYPH
jgi:hypothetical protein